MKKKEGSYDYFFEKSGYEVPAHIHFFNHLMLTPKPDVDKASAWELILWFAKVNVGLGFFKFGGLKHNFYTWITQYYPFSLLLQDKIYHANNKKQRLLVEKLEKMVGKYDVKMLIKGSDAEGDMIIFTTIFEKFPNDSKLKLFEKDLQKKFGSVYVRNNEGNVNIVFPNQTLYEYYEHLQ